MLLYIVSWFFFLFSLSFLTIPSHFLVLYSEWEKFKSLYLWQIFRNKFWLVFQQHFYFYFSSLICILDVWRGWMWIIILIEVFMSQTHIWRIWLASSRICRVSFFWRLMWIFETDVGWWIRWNVISFKIMDGEHI